MIQLISSQVTGAEAGKPRPSSHHTPGNIEPFPRLPVCLSRGLLPLGHVGLEHLTQGLTVLVASF